MQTQDAAAGAVSAVSAERQGIAWLVVLTWVLPVTVQLVLLWLVGTVQEGRTCEASLLRGCRTEPVEWVALGWSVLTSASALGGLVAMLAIGGYGLRTRYVARRRAGSPAA